jgi:hypothetical protein
MAVAFPGESAEYRAARDRLLEQEIELRRAMEAVAAARRRLPHGGVVPQDYVFETQGPDGDPAEVRLSELFASGKNSLVIYSMMFPRASNDDRPGQKPCGRAGPPSVGRPHPQAGGTRRYAGLMTAPARSGLARPPCLASSYRARSQ